MCYAALVIISGVLALRLRAAVAAPGEVIACTVWFALAAFCLLQAVPMPIGWLWELAPRNADIWSRSLRPFGLPAPAFASISLAPQRTIVKALELASYGVAFAVSARLARQCGLQRLAWVAFASALAVALGTAVHQLTGAERLYGIYAPLQASDVAPLLNPNSRAGYLNLGFFCGLGLLFRAGKTRLGALLGLGLVLLIAAILLCQSRGGTACLGIGMLLVLFFRPAGSTRRHAFGKHWERAVLLLLAGSAMLMVLTARREGALGFEDQSREKLDLMQRAAQLVIDHPGWGVGRGAFGSVFSEYQAPSWPRVYEHAENLPLQWAAEWGIPVTVLSLSAFAGSLWPALRWRSLSSPVRRCALVGCVVLLGQNLVDLGLEIPAVAALFACVLGALSGTAPSAPAAAQVAAGVPLAMQPRLLWGGALLTLGCLALAMARGSDSPERERGRLHAELTAANGSPSAAFWVLLRHAVEAYPADPYFPLLGSAAALASGQNVLPWVARALERGPSSGTAHVHLAQALRARGATDQALGALRHAARLDPLQADTATRLALRWSPARVLDVVPEGARGAVVLRALADRTHDPAERLHWREQALARSSDDPGAHYQLAVDFLHHLASSDGGVVCRDRRDWCLRAALSHASRAELPNSSRVAILKARLLEWQSGPRDAEAELDRVCAELAGDVACARELVALAIKNRSPRLPGAVDSLVAQACGTRESCSQVHMSLGQQFAAAGQWHSAASHFRQATEEMPSPGSWRAVAQASAQLGQEARAADALRRAELLDVASSAPK